MTSWRTLALLLLLGQGSGFTQQLPRSSALPESTTTALYAEKRSWRKLVGGSLLALTTFLPSPAQAKFSYELTDTPTKSIRPGMTQTQADLVEQGELDARDFTPSQPALQSIQSKTSTVVDYGDDEDDDYLTETDVGPTIGTQADLQASQNLGKVSQFAGYHQPKTTTLTLKVGAAVFVPTFGAQIAREAYRRRKEEIYVKKGLEVLEAQKAEYFNITAKTADSDVEDELKDLKKDDDDENDDDDEEDDDEEDDEDDQDDEPQSRRRPKKPTPPDDNDGGDSDPGYGKPSDEDLDRLNKMFGKS